MTTPVLRIGGLRVDFPGDRGWASALDGVDLELWPGEIFGLVGESGCGKTTLALAAMQLLAPTARVSGTVELLGRDLVGRTAEELRRVRAMELGMVFQDPLTSLDPMFAVGEQVAERFRAAGVSRKEARRRAVDAMRDVGIPDPERRYDDPPHRFSGGMRQRLVIAIALANDPRLLIADEPTTALDVTIQADILALLRRRCEASGTAMLLITHDLGVVAEVCERVGVLYAGQLVEIGATADLFRRTAHPYTEALLGALPTTDQAPGTLAVISGEIPDLEDPPAGCRFAPRCRHRMAVCDQRPALEDREGAHHAACWLEAR